MKKLILTIASVALASGVWAQRLPEIALPAGYIVEVENNTIGRSADNNPTVVNVNVDSYGIVITPLAVGETTFTLIPVKAGEYKSKTNPITEGKTETLSIGTSGIELIDMSNAYADVECHDLNGLNVNNPEKDCRG